MKFTRERTESIIAAATVAISIALAALGLWVFHSPADLRHSVAKVILSDMITLGFFRLLVAAAALYGLASIAVLVTRGNWIRSISATGIDIDVSKGSEQIIETLKNDVREARAERDKARQLLWRDLSG